MKIRQFAEIARILIIILLITNLLLIAAVGYLFYDKYQKEQEQLSNCICQEELIPVDSNNQPPFEILEELE